MNKPPLIHLAKRLFMFFPFCAHCSQNKEFKPNIPLHIHQVNNYTYTEKSGKSFYSIAHHYNVSISDIWAWNKMNKEVKLVIGKKLLIKFDHNYEPSTEILAQENK